MDANFEECLEAILEFEGGYSDHPSDPGGATNLGITKAVLEAWRGHSVSKADMRALKLAEAADIYRARYWDRCRCGELQEGLDLAVFDCAVNQGVGRAQTLLQQALRVTVDGIIGPKTLAAANQRNAGPLLAEFCARRMAAYGNLTTLFKTFGLGWSRRLLTVHGKALAMAIAAEVDRSSEKRQGAPTSSSQPPLPPSLPEA